MKPAFPREPFQFRPSWFFSQKQDPKWNYFQIQNSEGNIVSVWEKHLQVWESDQNVLQCLAAIEVLSLLKVTSASFIFSQQPALGTLHQQSLLSWAGPNAVCTQSHGESSHQSTFLVTNTSCLDHIDSLFSFSGWKHSCH